MSNVLSLINNKEKTPLFIKTNIRNFMESANMS